MKEVGGKLVFTMMRILLVFVHCWWVEMCIHVHFNLFWLELLTNILMNPPIDDRYKQPFTDLSPSLGPFVPEVSTPITVSVLTLLRRIYQEQMKEIISQL